ncbi:hypothetical protein M405DRAFT_430100 [Rhizopogon salebrosus TDB-379]|nr:hypothetical protein M405DRAFT_430100 [Rhizopogon salebrosus TDB-379]
MVHMTIVSLQPGISDAVLCTKANCRKHDNQAWKANKNCIRQYCKRCCEVAGGCKVHRVALVLVLRPPGGSLIAIQQCENSTVPPLTTVNSASTSEIPLLMSQPLPAAPQTYARPFDTNYARNYIPAHQRTLEAEQRFQADQNLSMTIRNTIDVVLWLKTDDPPHQMRLARTMLGKEGKSRPVGSPPVHRLVTPDGQPVHRAVHSSRSS